MRQKYKAECDKRVRADGEAQYIELAGAYARYAEEDPYANVGVTRPALSEELEIAVIGGGFCGLLAGAACGKRA